MTRTIEAMHVETVCRPGAGADTCSFLISGEDGYECAKGTPLWGSIAHRRACGFIVAAGDNCDGWVA